MNNEATKILNLLDRAITPFAHVSPELQNLARLALEREKAGEWKTFPNAGRLREREDRIGVEFCDALYRSVGLDVHSRNRFQLKTMQKMTAILDHIEDTERGANHAVRTPAATPTARPAPTAPAPIVPVAAPVAKVQPATPPGGSGRARRIQAFKEQQRLEFRAKVGDALANICEEHDAIESDPVAQMRFYRDHKTQIDEAHRLLNRS